MPFEWDIYPFELESAENPLMSTSHGLYCRIEQTSEAIKETFKIYRSGGREDHDQEPLL